MKRWIWLMLLVTGVLPMQAQQPLPFTAGGPLAFGGAEWQANGLINRVIFYPGEVIEIAMAVGMRLPDGDVTLPYTMSATLSLQPLHTAGGFQLPYDAREPWSPFVAAGLPLSNVGVPARAVAAAQTRAINVLDDQTLSFELQFRAELPADIDDGYYAVVLTGSAAIGDSAPFDWYANRIFSTTGTGREADVDRRLPLVLRVGDVSPPQLEWVLNGSLLPQESFSAVTQPRAIVQPPGIVNLQPMLGGLSFPPLLPSGGITGRIDSLGVRRLLGTAYNATLSTVGLPFSNFSAVERAGEFVRLIPTDPSYIAEFRSYGVYRVFLRGTISDIFGNQYRGGGTYEIVIAEPLTLIPRVPDGYPLPVGEPLRLGFSVLPGFTGQGELTLRFEPASGAEPTERLFLGSVRAGQFVIADPITFEEPGEYQLRYRAQMVDGEERLWYAERTAVGVVVAGDSFIMARGRRGVDGYTRHPQPHFDAATFPFDAVLAQTLVNTPYLSGDVVEFAPGENAGLRPALTFQDVQGDAAALVLARLRGYQNAEGDLAELLRRDSLPLVYPDSYGLLTISTPAQHVRAFAQGRIDGLLTPRISLAGAPVGTLLTWFGGVRLFDPAQTAGYGAAVRIVAQGARVLPAARVARQWLTHAGMDGTVIPWREGGEWWLQAIPTTLPPTLTVRVVGPAGVDRRLPAVPVGQFGLVRALVPPDVLRAPGLYTLALQDEATRGTLATTRWIVARPEQTLTLTNEPLTPLTNAQATLRAELPAGWGSLRGTVIVAHPQGTLETRSVTVSGRQWSVTLNRAEWLRAAPWAAIGAVRVTLLLEGVDEGGQPVFAVRAVTVQSERVVRGG